MTSEVQDPKVLYLYLSLSTGTFANSSATSRMETILKSNKIPFKAIDVPTDDRARSIWGRRKGPNQKLPALVRDGLVIGDLAEVEEWNECGELKQRLGVATGAAPALSQKATTSTVDTKPTVTSPSASTPAAGPSSSTTAAAAIAAEAAAAANKKKEEAKK
ncbi:hypothetical protein TWF696_009563 [Orbilia brochopaga]|uniref:Uncharacterized protein n=1 Tax=Orbilia brochopaga TaxID=3140254 RepID=A0AAV9UBE2_9PEZI